MTSHIVSAAQTSRRYRISRQMDSPGYIALMQDPPAQAYTQCVTFEILRELTMMATVFLNVTSCLLEEV
jgi:hypothetical protein